jgi:L-glutamine-phosphate cytidylyltransferase
MRGIILTAGRGDRLRPVTGNRPKCLATVGGCTILERQIRALRACGVTRIVVITGYRSDVVRRMCGPSIEFVHNPRYAVTNSLYSLWLARHLLGEGFVVLNCDVVFHRQLLADLLTARYEDALLVAFRGRDELYSDEEMKLRVRNGRVTEISKTLGDGDADGESIGIAKFGAAGAALLVGEMNRLVASGAIRDWVPAAFAGFCRRRPLYAVDHRGLPWIEIDSPNDYWRACTHIAPALDDAGTGGDAASDPGLRTATARRAADHV